MLLLNWWVRRSNWLIVIVANIREEVEAFTSQCCDIGIKSVQFSGPNCYCFMASIHCYNNNRGSSP